jgi:hypothetical protein
MMPVQGGEAGAKAGGAAAAAEPAGPPITAAAPTPTSPMDARQPPKPTAPSTHAGAAAPPAFMHDAALLATLFPRPRYSPLGPQRQRLTSLESPAAQLDPTRGRWTLPAQGQDAPQNPIAAVQPSNAGSEALWEGPTGGVHLGSLGAKDVVPSSGSCVGSSSEAVPECVMCLDAPRQSTLAPCGHRVLCMPCTLALLGRQEPLCPICRARVLSYISTVFDA